MEVCGKNTKREKPIVRISNNYHFLIINVCQLQFNFTNPRFFLGDSPSSVQRSILAYLDYKLVVREHLPKCHWVPAQLKPPICITLHHTVKKKHMQEMNSLLGHQDKTLLQIRTLLSSLRKKKKAEKYSAI